MGSSQITLNGAPRALSLVIFDMDGTLTESRIDFSAIRREVGAPDGVPLLEYMESAPPQRRQGIMEALDRHEMDDALTCRLKPDAPAVLGALKAKGLKLAILTRNSGRSAQTILRRHRLAVDLVVAREDAPPKPDPASVLAVCSSLGARPGETLVVGDYLFDIMAGRGAGAATALLENEKMKDVACPADFRLKRLSDIMGLLDS